MKLPRPKRPRERVATPSELADEAERCRRAREQHRPLAPAPIEANLCATLVYLAAWRPCRSCGTRVLFVDERARTDTAFTCGRCEARKEALAKQAQKPAASGCPSCGSLATFLDGPISRPTLSCGSCLATWPASRPPSPLARVVKALRSLVMTEAQP